MAVDFDSDAFLTLGLNLDSKKDWQNRCKKTSNVLRFRQIYGAYPKTCESMWNDMKTSRNMFCQLDKSSDPKHFLLALRFLYEYPTETQLSGRFGMAEKSIRKWTRIFQKKIAILLLNKVRNNIYDRLINIVIFVLPNLIFFLIVLDDLH